MREDYSDNGDAWSYFSHDQARSRAYRWGEDGLAGISDDKQRLCLALALWNERDPILKERLFGLTNTEGNHGEDVKEYYFYVDNLPTHSYQRLAVQVPTGRVPVRRPVADQPRTLAARRSEYELHRHRRSSTSIAISTSRSSTPRRVRTTCSAGSRCTTARREAAPLHVLPTLWFRNTWSWLSDAPQAAALSRSRRVIRSSRPSTTSSASSISTRSRARRCCSARTRPTRTRSGATEPTTPLCQRRHRRARGRAAADAVNPDGEGTKAAAHLRLVVPASGSQRLVRLGRRRRPETLPHPFAGADALIAHDGRRPTSSTTRSRRRRRRRRQGGDAPGARRHAVVQAVYYFDVDLWLRERGAHPLRAPMQRGTRNESWFHMVNDDVVSMPDKWEYPWYAAWDLAFHTVPLAMVDPDFAEASARPDAVPGVPAPDRPDPRLRVELRRRQPAGARVRDPVHAPARRRERGEVGSGRFLQECFARLLLNFTWWVNRKDPSGRNVFEGGFLGLDNIGVFDRSASLPTGGRLEQADGTAWMAMFSQNMLELALALARARPDLRGVRAQVRRSTSSGSPPPWIRSASTPTRCGTRRTASSTTCCACPMARGMRLKVRSLVGLLPLCATTVIDADVIERLPADRRDRSREFSSATATCSPTSPTR